MRHRSILQYAGTSRLRAPIRLIVLLGIAAGAPVVRAEPPSAYPPLMTAEIDASIQRGLKYLAAKQSSDGAFRESGHMGSYPVAMTALSGLAFASSGSTPMQGPYAVNIRRAMNFVLRSTQRNGLICRTGDEESRSMYGHGFSMLFLAEMMGMEENLDRLEQIRYTLRRGVDLIARSQSALGGWLYTPDMNGDEGSVTITQVQALRAARNAGIAVPKTVVDRAMKYLEKSIQPDGGIAYRVGMSGSRPPITAAAVACWFNAGEYDNPMALNALRYCKRTIGIGDRRGGTWGHWFYAHFYMAQVMYLAGEKDWTDYYPKLAAHLIAMQNDDGSWEGDGVGRVYGTAIALTILQLPNNTLPIMQR
jgi:hypothetical protein